MANKNLTIKQIRVDDDFVKKLRSTIPNRLVNFPDENIQQLTDRELTRMMKNTEGFQNGLKELETLPRREK